jgi:hypothetical protein
LPEGIQFVLRVDIAKGFGLIVKGYFNAADTGEPQRDFAITVLQKSGEIGQRTAMR